MIIGEIRRFLRDDGMIKVSRTVKETAVRARQLQAKYEAAYGIELLSVSWQVLCQIAPEELAASLLMEHDDLVILDEKKNVIFSSFSNTDCAELFENQLSEIKNYEITELDGKKYFTTSNSVAKIGNGSIIIFQII